MTTRSETLTALFGSAIRRPGLGLLLTIAAFVALTTYPYKLVNPFARSRFTEEISAGFRFSPPSLFRSAVGIEFFDSAPFKQGRFSVEFWLKPERGDQRESSRIVSYSLDEENPVWMLSHSGEVLYVKHRGRAGYFPVLEIGKAHHYLVSLSGDRVDVYKDGVFADTRRLRKPPRAWFSAHLSIANEITGDRPLVGSLKQFTLFPRTLSPADARQRFRGRSIDEPSYALLGDENTQTLWLQGQNARIPLERVAWPYQHKWELPRTPYLTRWHLLIDVVLNIVGTIPSGFFLMLLLCRSWPRGGITNIVLAGVCHAALSVTVEAAQFFSTELRFPNLVDVATNTLGGLAGALFVYKRLVFFTQRAYDDRAPPSHQATRGPSPHRTT